MVPVVVVGSLRRLRRRCSLLFSGGRPSPGCPHRRAFSTAGYGKDVDEVNLKFAEAREEIEAACFTWARRGGAASSSTTYEYKVVTREMVALGQSRASLSGSPVASPTRATTGHPFISTLDLRPLNASL
uniref:Uncharacterized protein n=1 Tax=Oryza barthii TaxID=65489 RepID=A0A0D3GRV6_9ORYZ